MPLTLNISVANGKYTVQMDDTGHLRALRYGHEWRDCIGDKLIYCLAAEVETLREEIAALKAAKTKDTDPMNLSTRYT